MGIFVGRTFGNIYSAGRQSIAMRGTVNSVAGGEESVSRLYFAAGQKAVATSNFLAASQNLILGIDLLDPRSCWRDQYNLSLALFYNAAEVEFCIGNVSLMNERIDVLLQHVRRPEDKASGVDITRECPRGTGQCVASLGPRI